MRTGFLWAASAAATIFALASVDRSAEARGDRGAGYYYTAMPRAVVAPRPVRRGYRPAAKPAPAAKGPGLCGTYKYWKGGKCNDARGK